MNRSENLLASCPNGERETKGITIQERISKRMNPHVNTRLLHMLMRPKTLHVQHTISERAHILYDCIRSLPVLPTWWHLLHVKRFLWAGWKDVGPGAW